MDELLLEELKDLYSAEKQITKSLPKMAKKATSPELKQAFENHLQETLGQIERLDQIFDILNKPHKAKLCHGMQGVLEEGKEAMEEVEQSDLLDAAMIGAASRVEHYEMAGYTAVIGFATALGHDDVARLLTETLKEEEAADKKLQAISQQVNSTASEAVAA
jgi:ferritin-like metal-binding protein YciE